MHGSSAVSTWPGYPVVGRDWHPLLPVRTNWEVGTGKDEPLLTPRVGAHHGGVSARAAAELLLCSCRDIHLPF